MIFIFFKLFFLNNSCAILLVSGQPSNVVILESRLPILSAVVPNPREVPISKIFSGLK